MIARGARASPKVAGSGCATGGVKLGPLAVQNFVLVDALADGLLLFAALLDSGPLVVSILPALPIVDNNVLKVDRRA